MVAAAVPGGGAFPAPRSQVASRVRAWERSLSAQLCCSVGLPVHPAGFADAEEAQLPRQVRSQVQLGNEGNGRLWRPIGCNISESLDSHSLFDLQLYYLIFAKLIR